MADNKNEIYAQLDAFRAKLGSELEKVTKRVQELIKSGMAVEDAVKTALDETKVMEKRDTLLIEAITEAAKAGGGTEAGQKARDLILADAWAPDEMKLSERLHGASAEMRQAIVDSVTTSMRLNKGWLSTARDLYDGYNAGHITNQAELSKYLDDVAKLGRRVLANDPEALKKYQAKVRQAIRLVDRLSQFDAPTKALKTAYGDLLKETTLASEKAFAKAIKLAVEEKSRYIADRIARTEISRAWGVAVLNKYRADPDIIGFKWTLGARHRIFDICDFHAEIDSYGLGKGIYPKDVFPVRPAHPHCMCGITPIFAGQLNPDEGAESKQLQAAAFDEDKARQYLGSLPDYERTQLLGVGGGKKYLNGEADWQQVLRGWQPHEKAKK